MAFKTKSLGLTALLALSAFALANQAGPLVRKPTVGEELKYRLKANVELGGIAVEFSGLLTEKTTEVSPDGTYTVESKTGDIKVLVNGEEIAGAGDQVPPGTTTVYNADGTLKEIRGDQADASAYRMANLQTLFLDGKASKIGDEWTNDKPADSKSGAAAYKSTYKIVGEEKVGAYDTWKVEFTTKETEGDAPASSDGTIWVNKADATLVKTDAKWSNAPFPGAPGPVSGTVVVNRE